MPKRERFEFRKNGDEFIVGVSLVPDTATEKRIDLLLGYDAPQAVRAMGHLGL